MTLSAHDRKAEYSYQTSFNQVPQVVWGLCSFNFDLDSRQDHLTVGYPPQKPNAIGVRVNAYSSKTALILKAFDLGCGDSTVVTVDVCFQALSLIHI